MQLHQQKRRSIGLPRGVSILSSLKATEALDIQPRLPAELIARIIDLLPVRDQMRFARTARRYRNIVYEDSRWVARLESIGCWDEQEARHHAAAAAENAYDGRHHSRMRESTATLFDAQDEERAATARAAERSSIAGTGPTTNLEDRLRSLDMNATASGAEAPEPNVHDQSASTVAAAADPMQDPEALLSVLKTVRSVRGQARAEYGRIYRALAPFYVDLVMARSHTDPVVFKLFRDPERQARMLHNLLVFARSDWSAGWRQRGEKLTMMTGLFETAVLREFERGYEAGDVDGRMRRFASVLDLLNGGTACTEVFIQRNPLLMDQELASCYAEECTNGAQSGQEEADDVNLQPARRFFGMLETKVNEQAGIIRRVFPKPGDVFWSVLNKVREEVISEYINTLLDETHRHSVPLYLKAVTGVFRLAVLLVQSLDVPSDPVEDTGTKKDMGALQPDSSNGLESSPPPANVLKVKTPQLSPRVREFLLRLFELHLDLYLQEELEYFTKFAEKEVADWDKKLVEQDATAERFYMSNLQRQADKKDFLSSFRKVVMMPVTAMSPFTTIAKPQQLLSASTSYGGSLAAQDPSTSTNAKRNSSGPPITTSTTTTSSSSAPTDELAAKAELMASRLEGIKSLFSIEMAVRLVNAAKESLDRAVPFIQLGGRFGEEARDQCAAVFVTLLRVLGSRHLQPGFDRAIGHLGSYRARDAVAQSTTGAQRQHQRPDQRDVKPEVAPLIMFSELVNVGDLIGQMMEVFYEQQLVATRIADKNDFMDAAGLAKRRFEQLLDESVARGLNKGIDALMDEVEFVCATTQKPTDYNPLGIGLNTGVGGGAGVVGAASAGAAAAATAAASSISSIPSFAAAALQPSSTSFSPSKPRPSQQRNSFTSFTSFVSSSSSSSPSTKTALKRSSTNSSTMVSPTSSSSSSTSTPYNHHHHAADGSSHEPTPTARAVVALVQHHTTLLTGSGLLDKPTVEVFNTEVGLRLFTALCKHIKRQRISTGAGAVRLIADARLYFDFARQTLRVPELVPFYAALRELCQIFLIDARDAKHIAAIVADGRRFAGVWRPEEALEFAERRADWFVVRRDVERAMYGLDCRIM